MKNLIHYQCQPVVNLDNITSISSFDNNAIGREEYSITFFSSNCSAENTWNNVHWSFETKEEKDKVYNLILQGCSQNVQGFEKINV